MKIIILFFIITVFNVNATLYSQSTSLELSVKNKSVREILKIIERQSNFRFFYNDEFSDLNRTITLDIKDKKVDEVLEVLLAQSNVTYKILENDVVVITPATGGTLQQQRVSGKVVSKDGTPMPGVNIVEKGSTNGVISNIDGNFTITVQNPSAVLVFSFVGYTSVEVPVNEQTTINVTLEEDVAKIDEIVVVGYGVQKKKLVTGANTNVKGEDIQALNTTTAIDALKGITPGVSITQKNGQPGAGSKVYIRGMGTIGDASPLFIVDGVIQGDIDYLNPGDIASMDILKDAASSAIYGSRAANGVILITTKTGKRNMKPAISYDGYTGWQNVYKVPDLLNAREYAFIMDESRVNSGLAPHDYATLVPRWNEIEAGTWNGTNWFKEMMVKDAPVQSHSLSIQGGSERTSYSLGASYLDQDGVFGKQSDNYYKRYTVRLNTENVLYSKGSRDILLIGENLTYTKYRNNTIRQGNIYSNDVHNALVASPFLSLYDNEGEYTLPIAWDPTYGVNPAGLMDYNTKYGENDNNKIVGAFYLVFEPIKNLKYRTSYGINTSWGSSRQWIPDYNLGPVNTTDGDKVTETAFINNTYIWDNTLTYNYKLNNHSFSAMIGNSVEKDKEKLNLSIVDKKTLYGDYEHGYISNSTENTSAIGKDEYGWGMLSYFGRVTYDYKETYLFSAMLRADGSSRFTKENRWGYFPSVSAGWVASNQSFMSSVSNVVNFLKVRGSWGQVGNEKVGNFLYSSTMSYKDINDYYFNNYAFGTKDSMSIGTCPSRIPNPDITWETSEQLNLGFDARFFNSRLSLIFDWYKKDTKDWLVETDIPANNGVDDGNNRNKMTINGGQVTNKGVEFALGWEDKVQNFRYGATASLARNKNKVTKIANSEKIVHGATNVLSQGTGEIFRAQVGYPIGYFWGLQTDGVIQNEAEAEAWVAPEGAPNAGQPYFNDQRPGDLRWVDQNKDGSIDDDDKVMIGDPNPDYILGFQIHCDYKGLSLSATANGAFGQQIAKSYRSFADSYKNNYTTDIFDRWHGEGTSNKVPRLNSSPHRNMQNLSDLYIQDGDFFRISNITLGYDFKKLLKKLPLNEVRFYVSVKNLYTFTKYDGMDPEIGYGDSDTNKYGWASGVDLGLYPSARTVLCGLSLKF